MLTLKNLGAAVLFGLCIAAQAPAYAQKTLKLAFVTVANSYNGAGATAFADVMAKETGGKVKVSVFPGGQLGGEREMVEGLTLGTLDMAFTTTGPLGNFASEINVLDLPFLFRDAKHARAVLDSAVGVELAKKLEAQGIVVLGWGEAGFRHLTNSKHAVTEPKDLKGLKIRTMENEIHMNTFRQLGALPTPMSFTELYTSLQQNIVDGQENPLVAINIAKFQQVQKHLTLTGHAYSASVVMMSKAAYNRLTPAEQATAQLAGKAAAQAMRNFMDKADADALKELKAGGMTVVVPDRKQFEEFVEPVYKKYTDKYGKTLLEKVRSY